MRETFSRPFAEEAGTEPEPSRGLPKSFWSGFLPRFASDITLFGIVYMTVIQPWFKLRQDQFETDEAIVALREQRRQAKELREQKAEARLVASDKAAKEAFTTMEAHEASRESNDERRELRAQKREERDVAAHARD